MPVPRSMRGVSKLTTLAVLSAVAGAQLANGQSVESSVTVNGLSTQAYRYNMRGINRGTFEPLGSPNRDTSARPVASTAVDMAIVGVKKLHFTPTFSFWTFADGRDKEVHEYDLSVGAAFDPIKVGKGAIIADVNYLRYGYPQGKKPALLCWTEACHPDHLAMINARYQLPLAQWGQLEVGTGFAAKLNDPHRGTGVAPFARVSHPTHVKQKRLTLYAEAASARTFNGYFTLPSQWQGARVAGGAVVALGKRFTVSGGVDRYWSTRPQGMKGSLAKGSVTYTLPAIKLRR